MTEVTRQCQVVGSGSPGRDKDLHFKKFCVSVFYRKAMSVDFRPLVSSFPSSVVFSYADILFLKLDLKNLEGKNSLCLSYLGLPFYHLPALCTLWVLNNNLLVDD